jgi:hypothetical protein
VGEWEAVTRALSASSLAAHDFVAEPDATDRLRGAPNPGRSCAERGSCGAPYGRGD